MFLSCWESDDSFLKENVSALRDLSKNGFIFVHKRKKIRLKQQLLSFSGLGGKGKFWLLGVCLVRLLSF